MTPEELEAGFQGAPSILTGNDYEFGMMAEKLGIAEPDLRARVPITVVTKGEAGALITVDGQEYEIPPAKPDRRGRPHRRGRRLPRGPGRPGMARGFSWPVVGKLGALTAVYAIEQAGTQHHSYTLATEFVDRYTIQLRPLGRGRSRFDRRDSNMIALVG